MRKNILIGILLILILLTGCAKKPDYQDYKNALEKTENIKRGAQEISIDVNQSFDDSLKDEEWTKSFSNISLKISGNYDNEELKSIYGLYFLYDELGTDAMYYRLGEKEEYIKLAMLPSYIKLELENFTEVKSSANVESSENIDRVVEDITREIGVKWNNILREDNIFIGEKITIQNEDGSVKARKFTIRPTSAQLEEFTGYIHETLIEHADEIVVIINEIKPELNFSRELLETILSGVFKTMVISSYEEIAFVDSDGYVIDEHISIGIDYKSTDEVASALKNQQIVIKTKNWDIEKKQVFNFPEINEDNIVNLKELGMKNQVE